MAGQFAYMEMRYREYNGDETWTYQTSTDPNPTFKITSGLIKGGIYACEVRNVDTDGSVSDWTSIQITAANGANPLLPPVAIALVAVTGGIQVSWAINGLLQPQESYEIQRAPDVSGSPGTFSKIALTSALQIVDPLNDSNFYWYQVRTTDAAGNTSTFIRSSSSCSAISTGNPGLETPSAVLNPYFEAGDKDWTKDTGWTIVQDAVNVLTGTWCGKFTGAASGYLKNNGMVPVVPTQLVNVSIYAKAVSGTGNLQVCIQWLDATLAVVATDTSTSLAGSTTTVYSAVSLQSVAPSNAKFCRIAIYASGVTTGAWYVDNAYLYLATSSTLTPTQIANINMISDLSNDNLLTIFEKPGLYNAWQALSSDQSGLDSEAGTLGVLGSVIGAYDTAMLNLRNYMVGTVGLTLGTNDAAWQSNTTSVAINGQTLRNLFAQAYSTEQALIDACSTTIATLASGASTDAGTALNKINDISADNKLTNVEKLYAWADLRDLLDTHQDIISKAIGAALLNDATGYKTFDDAINALDTYVRAAAPVGTAGVNDGLGLVAYSLTPPHSGAHVAGTWNVTAVNNWFAGDTVNIDGPTFRTKFSDCYRERILLLNKITDVIRVKTDTNTTKLSNIASDGVVSKSEKVDVFTEYKSLIDEEPSFLAMATANAAMTTATLTSANTYRQRIWELQNYMNTVMLCPPAPVTATDVSPWTISTPTNSPVGSSNLDTWLAAGTANGIAGDTLIPDRAAFLVAFTNVYAAKASLQQSIANTHTGWSWDAPNNQSVATSVATALANAWDSANSKAAGVSAAKAEADAQQAITTAAAQATQISTLNTNLNTAASNASQALTNAGLAQTKADSAWTLANQASSDASTAKTEADAATIKLTDIASDSKITPDEKSAIFLEWRSLYDEHGPIDTQADLFVVSRTAYDTAFVALQTYLNNAPISIQNPPTDGRTWSADQTTITLSVVVTGATTAAESFRKVFTDVFTARQLLLNAIAGKAKSLADQAQISANSANNALADMASDLKITQYEKNSVMQAMLDCYNEYSGIIALAAAFTNPTVSSTNYASAWSTLTAYAQQATSTTVGTPGGLGFPTSPSWATDVAGRNAWITNATTFVIDGPTFRANFAAYYTQRQTILNAIATADKTIGDAANTKLADIANDSKLDQTEKNDVMQDLVDCYNEYAGIVALAATFTNPTVSSANYTAAWSGGSGLRTYAEIASSTTVGTPGGLGVPTSPSWTTDVAGRNTWITNTTTFIIDGPTFRLKFATYYQERQNILNAIAATTKTISDTASSNASQAASDAATAKAEADTATIRLNDITSDSAIDQSEKSDVYLDWKAIYDEHADIDAKGGASGYNITTGELANYDTAWSALQTYLQAAPISIPNLASATAAQISTWINTTATIVLTSTALEATAGGTFRKYFTNVYSTRQLLLNAIAAKAKALADQANNGITTINNTLADMASDNKLTQYERQSVLQALLDCYNEYASIVALAGTFTTPTVPSTNYTAAWSGASGLKTYAEQASSTTVGTPGGLGLPTSPSWTTDVAGRNTWITTATALVIDGPTFRARFATYYSERQLLLNAIAAANKTIGDTATSKIGDIGNDNKLDQTEKNTVMQDMVNAYNEYAAIVALAATFTTPAVPSTNYTNAWSGGSGLRTYAEIASSTTVGTPGGLGFPTSPSWTTDVAGRNTWITNTTSFVIDGPTFRLKFATYYQERANLLNAISSGTKTIVDSANAAAQQAASDASTAKTQAQTANTAIADISSDNKVSQSEKGDIATNLRAAFNEYAGIITSAGLYTGISTTNYTAAWSGASGLKTYAEQASSTTVNGGLGLPTSPSWTTDDAGLTTWVNNTSSLMVDGPTLRARFTTYYKERQNILNAVASAAQSYANTINTNVNTMSTTISGINTAANQAAADALTAKNNAQTALDAANAATGRITAISADGTITPNERPILYKDWKALYDENSDITSKAAAFNPNAPTTIDWPLVYNGSTLYNTNWTNLRNYLQGTPISVPNLQSAAQSVIDTWVAGSTDIVLTGSAVPPATTLGATFRQYFTLVYSSRQALLNAMADAARAQAVTAKTAADNASKAAGDAMTAANGKNHIFFQASTIAPSGPITGDLWFKTDLSYVVYYYNGTAWVTYSGGNPIVASQITAGLIQANMIGANQISARHLAANEITASRLTIANIENLFANPTSEIAPPANVSGDTSTPYVVTPQDMEFYCRKDTGGIGDGATATLAYAGQFCREIASATISFDIVARPGEQYYFEAQGNRRVGSATGDCIWLLPIDAAGVGIGAGWISPSPVAGAWSLISVTSAVLPAKTVKLRVGFQAGTGNTTWFDQMYLRQMSIGALLVDGAITSRHIQTDTITTKQITMVDWDNLWPNGNTEDALPAGIIDPGAGTLASFDEQYGWRFNAGAGAYSGSWVRQGTAGASQIQLQHNDCQARPGDQYYFESQVKLNTLGSGALILIAALNSAGSPVSGGVLGTDYWQSPILNTTGSWNLLSVTVPSPGLPAGTCYVRFALVVNANCVAQFDVMYARRMANANLIVDGAITANKLQAGAITTKTLSIINWDNLIPNPDSELGNSMIGVDPEGNWLVTIDDPANAYSGNRYRAAVGTAVATTNVTGKIPVIPGDNYYLELYIKSSGTALGCAYATFYGTGGVTLGTTYDLYTASITGTTYTKATLNIIIPAGALSMQIMLKVPSALAGNVYFDNMYLAQQADATLLVDGSITTRKMMIGDGANVLWNSDFGSVGTATYDDLLASPYNKLPGWSANANAAFLTPHIGYNRTNGATGLCLGGIQDAITSGQVHNNVAWIANEAASTTYGSEATIFQGGLQVVPGMSYIASIYMGSNVGSAGIQLQFSGPAAYQAITYTYNAAVPQYVLASDGFVYLLLATTGTNPANNANPTYWAKQAQVSSWVPAYNNANPYAVNDYVIDNTVAAGNLYRCIQAQAASAGKTPNAQPTYWVLVPPTYFVPQTWGKNPGELPGGVTLSNYKRIWVQSIAPAWATTVSVICAFWPTYNSMGTWYFTRAQLEISDAAQPGIWNAGGSTVIDGSGIVTNSLNANRITAGTITGDRIGVNQISANLIKLDTVGGGALNLDPNFSDYTAWNGGTTAGYTDTDPGYLTPALFTTLTDTVAGAVGSTCLRSAVGTWASAWTPRIPVDILKSYRVHANFRSTNTAATYYIEILCYNGMGTYLGATIPANSATLPVANVWTPITASLTGGFSLLAGTAYVRLCLLLNYNSTAGATMDVQDARIEEMVPASLVVDGAISAQKMSIGMGNNLLPNADFSSLGGMQQYPGQILSNAFPNTWLIYGNTGTGGGNWRWGCNFYSGTTPYNAGNVITADPMASVGAGLNTLVQTMDTGSVASTSNLYVYSTTKYNDWSVGAMLPAEPGKVYCASGYQYAHRGATYVSLEFFNEAGTNLQQSYSTGYDWGNNSASFSSLSAMQRQFIVATAPAGATRMRIGFICNPNSYALVNTAAAYYHWVCRPQLEESGSAISGPGPWVSGSQTFIDGASIKSDSLQTNDYVFSGTKGTATEVATQGARMRAGANTGGLLPAILTSPQGIKIGNETMDQKWLSTMRAIVCDVTGNNGVWTMVPYMGGGAVGGASLVAATDKNELDFVITGNTILTPSYIPVGTTLGVSVITQYQTTNVGSFGVPVALQLTRTSTVVDAGPSITVGFFLYNAAASGNYNNAQTGGELNPYTAGWYFKFKVWIWVSYPLIAL